jgi:hypothetical protein
MPKRAYGEGLRWRLNSRRRDKVALSVGQGLLFSADLEPERELLRQTPLTKDHAGLGLLLSGPLRPRAPLKTELGSHRPPGRGEKIL